MPTSAVAVVLAGICQDGRRGKDSLETFEVLVRRRRTGSDAVGHAVRALLDEGAVSPARLMKVLEKNPSTLPAAWPLLVEPLRAAALLPRSPAWVNRVLDTALTLAPHLRWAAESDRLPADATSWPGLTDLAARGATAVTRRKASQLVERLGPA